MHAAANPIVRSILALGAIGLTFAVFLHGHSQFGYRLLEKRPLRSDLIEVYSSAGLLIAAILLFLALRPAAPMRRRFGASEMLAGTTISLLMLAVLPLSAVAVIFWPDTFHTFVREGKPLSIATEIVFVAALVVLAYAAYRSLGMKAPKVFGVSPAVVVSAMWVVVFLILMEEMSWGQHWLGFSTPDAFSENLQNETNLHNFYTYRFEAAYYSVAVIAFVLLPFAWWKTSHPMLEAIVFYIPPRAFALAAIPLCSLMYESASFVMYQVWFALGVLICLDIWRHDKQPLGLVGAGLLCVCQAAYLYFGPALEHQHELTEVREFVIALCVLGYGVVLARRIVSAAPEGRTRETKLKTASAG